MADKKDKSTTNGMYLKERKSFDRLSGALALVLIILIGGIIALLFYQSRENEELRNEGQTVVEDSKNNETDFEIESPEEISLELVDSGAKIGIQIKIVLPKGSQIAKEDLDMPINPQVIFSNDEYELEIKYRRDHIPALYEVSDYSIVHTNGSLNPLYYFQSPSEPDSYLYTFDIFEGVKCESEFENVKEPCALNILNVSFESQLEIKCIEKSPENTALEICNKILEEAVLTSSSK